MTTFTTLRFLQIAAMLAALFFPEIAGAQSPTNQGNLNVNGRRIVFKNVAAVRAKHYGEGRVVVLATGQPVSAEVVRKVKEKSAEENLDAEVNQPYLKAVFLEDGVLSSLSGMGGNTSFGERGPPLEGQATIADGRIRGSLKAVRTGDFAKEVAMNFDVPIDAEVKAAGPAKLDPPVKPTLSGKFIGDGKAGAMKFVLVEEHEPFSGQEAVTLIFTEKDPATAKKPSFDAMFGKLGSALILNVHHDGGIFGCQVAHSAHSKQGFTSLGQIHMVEFEIAGGNVKGHVSTGGVLDTFEQKWEVDLKFAAPLPEKLRTASVAPKPVAPEARETTKPMPNAPTGPRIAARKLPLPKDATDVQFKQLVEQIQFSSAQPVEAVAKEFSANLKQQGWKEGAGSLLGKKNAILKREQGDAKLTIMVQPAAAGSVVKIFTEGLDWSGGDEGKPPAPPKADDDDGEDIEKEAEKLLKEALKKLPKGL